MSYFVPITTTLRDAFLDENALKYMQVVIDPAGTPATYVPVDISCNASEDYQKWSFTVKNKAGLSVGLHANAACVVQVSHDGATWVTVFTGYVSDDGFSRTRGMIHDDYLSLDLVDATKRKGTKRKPSPALLSNFKTVDTANTSTSILHYLANQMGVAVSTSDITQTHELVEIGKDTVWSELQKLKEAFHADMYFRYDGALLFRSPLEDDYAAPTSEWTFQGDPAEAVSGNACRIYGKLQEAYVPVRCNYARTKFTDYEQLSSRVIYKHTETLDSATDLISIEIGAGEYWPGPNATDVAKLQYASPDNGESYPFAINVVTPVIGAVGSGNNIEATGGNLTLVSFNGSTSATSHEAGAAQIILYNNSASTCTLRKLTITGEPYRKEADEVVEHVDSAVSSAIDYVEQEVDGKYMVSASQAFDTLYHMVEEGKGRPRRFAFDAPFMPWLQRRAIVSVQPPGESAVRCVVDTYNHKNRGKTLQGMRTSLVCTELGTHVPTGTPGIVIAPIVTPPTAPPIPSITLVANTNAIHYSDRNGLITSTVLFTLSVSNIDATTVTWEASDGTLSKVDDTQYSLDCSTVEGESSSVTVSATVGTTTFRATATVTKFYEVSPVLYLGAVTAMPTETFGGDDLMDGDYVLFVGATGTYTYGHLYVYQSGVWSETTDSEKVMGAQYDALRIAQDTGTTVYAALLVAEKILAQEIMVQGKIQSTNYAESGGVPTKGWLLDGPNDLLKAIYAVFYSATVYGDLIHDALETQEELTGSTIAAQNPANTLWSQADFYDNFPLSESWAWQSASGSYGGNTIVRATKLQTPNYLLFDSTWAGTSVSVPSGDDGTLSYVIPSGIGSVRVDLGLAWSARPSLTFVDCSGRSVGEASTSKTRSFVFNATAGETITVTYSNIPFGSQTLTVTRCNITTQATYSGAIVGYSDNTVQAITTRNTSAYQSFSFSLSSPSFDTSSILTRKSGTDIMSAFSAITTSWISISAGTVNNGGGAQTITRIRKVGTSLEFDTAGASVIVDSFVAGTATGVYSTLATTSITLVSQIGAILTKYLTPMANDLYDLGSSAKKYRDLYLSGDASIAGAITAGGALACTTINTGQGANELYAMNQNVRTTDSPTFVQITTTNGPNKPVDNNDASMPSIGVGGFTYGSYTNTTSENGSVTLPSGGTYICSVYVRRGNGTVVAANPSLRVAGSTALSMGGTFEANSYINVSAWRLA